MGVCQLGETEAKELADAIAAIVPIVRVRAGVETAAQSRQHHFRICVIPAVRTSSTSGSQNATLIS
ncbi:MAG: hypothetical protein JWP89_1527 [Schlesneria sp.]|nr:hypothetical protein [Schlesneria sp.]